MVPVSRVQCSVQRLGSPVPVGSTLMPNDFGVEMGPKSLPTPSPPPREAAQGQPGARDGGVGVRAKSTWEARGKQGQDAAVASRAARGLELALALILQSSEGRTGHTLPAVVLSATSPPLDRSRVGMAQKMLCRRLFPRPGC